MATLVVHRSSKFISRLRAFKVIVDGQTIGTVKNGETAEFEIPGGNHTLRTGISHMSGLSPVVNFSATNNEKVFFLTAPHPLMILFLIISVACGLGIGLSLNSPYNMQVLFVLLIPILICAFLAMKFAITLKQVYV